MNKVIAVIMSSLLVVGGLQAAEYVTLNTMRVDLHGGSGGCVSVYSGTINPIHNVCSAKLCFGKSRAFFFDKWGQKNGGMYCDVSQPWEFQQKLSAKPEVHAIDVVDFPGVVAVDKHIQDIECYDRQGNRVATTSAQHRRLKQGSVLPQDVRNALAGHVSNPEILATLPIRTHHTVRAQQLKTAKQLAIGALVAAAVVGASVFAYKKLTAKKNIAQEKAI